MGLTEASAFKDNSINTADLSSDTTDATKRAVTTNHIRDNAVTTAKVADLNVTTAKLANSTGTSDGVTCYYLRWSKCTCRIFKSQR